MKYSDVIPELPARVSKQTPEALRSDGKFASAYVTEAMRACLPPGVPLAFTIDRAHWLARTRKRARAEVTMFDGVKAELEVWAWSRDGGRAHMWVSLPGGDASFENGQWVRVPTDAPNPSLPSIKRTT